MKGKEQIEKMLQSSTKWIEDNELIASREEMSKELGWEEALEWVLSDKGAR